jgi:hypothetical protein
MSIEKVNAFKKYLREIITNNEEGILGTRAILNDAPSDKISKISGILK